MVLSETSKPSMRSSPWMRGAPQLGFSAIIWKMRENMAEIYNRTPVATKAAMLLIPQPARVLAKNSPLIAQKREWEFRCDWARSVATSNSRMSSVSSGGIHPCNNASRSQAYTSLLVTSALRKPPSVKVTVCFLTTAICRRRIPISRTVEAGRNLQKPSFSWGS